MKNSKRFIQHVRRHLKEFNFNLVLAKSKQVNTGTGFRCAGYFDEYSRTIRVATLSTTWLEVLVHEYCHFLDYLQSPRSVLNKENVAIGVCERHMLGDICHPISLKYAFRTVAKMEWKAEKQAQGVIKRFKLDIDIQKYSREANLYICLYHMYYKHASFITKKNPATRSILSKMPKHISNTMWMGISQRLTDSLSAYF